MSTDDLTKLGEAYPRVEEMLDMLSFSDEPLGDSDEEYLLSLAASLYASNRALNERIVTLRNGLDDVVFLGEQLDCPAEVALTKIIELAKQRLSAVPSGRYQRLEHLVRQLLADGIPDTQVVDRLRAELESDDAAQGKG